MAWHQSSLKARFFVKTFKLLKSLERGWDPLYHPKNVPELTAWTSIS